MTAEETRACTRCGKVKPLSAFPVVRDAGKLRRRGTCRECKRAADRAALKTPAGKARIARAVRAWRAAHPEQWRELHNRSQRAWYAKRKARAQEGTP